MKEGKHSASLSLVNFSIFSMVDIDSRAYSRTHLVGWMWKLNQEIMRNLKKKDHRRGLFSQKLWPSFPKM